MTTATLIGAAALAVAAVYLIRKVRHMSASLDRLKAAVASVSAKVTALEAQAPTGTPDSELDALSAQLESIAAPTVPAPPPAAE